MYSSIQTLIFRKSIFSQDTNSEIQSALKSVKSFNTASPRNGGYGIGSWGLFWGREAGLKFQWKVRMVYLNRFF